MYRAIITISAIPKNTLFRVYRKRIRGMLVMLGQTGVILVVSGHLSLVIGHLSLVIGVGGATQGTNDQ
jgi:hypothetical protein